MAQWYLKEAEAVLEQHAVRPEHGLSAIIAKQRLSKIGLNKLKSEKRINPFTLFIGQFKDVLVIILLIAAVVSWGIGKVEPGRSTEEVASDIFNRLQCGRATRDFRETDKYCASPLSICESELKADFQADCSNLKNDEGSQEAFLIFAIVFAIALIGFINEFKAEKTVEALKQLVGQRAKVRRDGRVIEIDAEALVPGDIVLLDEGVKIPADIRLLQVRNLQVNESSLTGESLPVQKQTSHIDADAGIGDQTNMVFAGTFVTQGTAEGVVVETAQRTELGKIASMVSNIDTEPTPMQRKLDDLGKKLGSLVLIICAAVFVIVLLFVDESRDKDFIQRMVFAFTAAVALAVAAIPEGLAFVVRISLALGARRMATKNALVRKLSAVEALGSTDVICSDKTGTLTKGEMTVRVLFAGGDTVGVGGSGYELSGTFSFENGSEAIGHAHERMLLIGALCNNARLKGKSVLGDPTEGSLLVSAYKAGYKYEKVQKNYPRVDEIPFTSERKFMSTVHQGENGAYMVAAKGSVESTLARCTKYLTNDGKSIALDAKIKKSIIQKNDELSSQALRVLAFAFKDAKTCPASEKEVESDLVFVGLQAMMDPPRQEVKEVIGRVQREAGIRVVMITGDYIETAQAVAHEIGIEGNAVSGAQLERMSQRELERQVESISVFARVSPEHKIRIVKALKRRGHQVAMTGDGVNDAPAIKAADIGIAMGITGTDASKEAADLILLDDRFLTIINAIEEGRGIFDNVRKFVNFLISCNIAEVLVIVFGIVFFKNLLLTAAQLLFINIVTDGLPAIALGSDPTRADALKAKPGRFQESILTKRVWTEIFIFGFLMTIALLLQYWYDRSHYGIESATSAVFAAMVIYELVRLIDIRTDYRIRWFSNPLLTVSIVASFALQIAVLYVPFMASYFSVGSLGMHDWIFMCVCSGLLFISMKLVNPVLDRLVGIENHWHATTN